MIFKEKSSQKGPSQTLFKKKLFRGYGGGGRNQEKNFQGLSTTKEKLRVWRSQADEGGGKVPDRRGGKGLPKKDYNGKKKKLLKGKGDLGINGKGKVETAMARKKPHPPTIKRKGREKEQKRIRTLVIKKTSRVDMAR